MAAKLVGKTALVTGGGVGIGRAIAVALASEGARIALTYRSHTPDEQLLRELELGSGIAPICVQMDATDEAEVTAAFATLGDELGQLNILVNNIGGLVERQHPGKRKTGKQVTFSTDLIYDVLRKYEPDHVLLEAAWADARTRLTDVGRLGDLLDRSAEQLVHVELDRVSPLAVPVMVMIGREATPQGSVDDELLLEAESLAGAAMRVDEVDLPAD